MKSSRPKYKLTQHYRHLSLNRMATPSPLAVIVSTGSTAKAIKQSRSAGRPRSLSHGQNCNHNRSLLPNLINTPYYHFQCWQHRKVIAVDWCVGIRWVRIAWMVTLTETPRFSDRDIIVFCFAVLFLRTGCVIQLHDWVTCYRGRPL